MRNRKAFTLIELIMVIVILGILAAVAIPKFVDLSEDAEESACEGLRGNVASACAIYYANEAAKGRSATFPDTTTTTGDFIEGGWPECPDTSTPGLMSYNSDAGTSACNVHT